jgi:hypothetical protein
MQFGSPVTKSKPSLIPDGHDLSAAHCRAELIATTTIPRNEATTFHARRLIQSISAASGDDVRAAVLGDQVPGRLAPSGVENRVGIVGRIWIGVRRRDVPRQRNTETETERHARERITRAGVRYRMPLALLLLALLLASCSGSSPNVPAVPPEVSPCSPLYETALGIAEVTAVAECKTAECGTKARAIVTGLRESAHRYCAEPKPSVDGG